MDEELERLRRAHERDPDDVEAARRYEQALLRAGRKDAVAELFRLKFVCDRQWSDMAETPQWDVRHCASCQKTVHHVRTYDQFVEHAREGRCVSVEGGWAVLVADLSTDPAAHFARADSDPCVVPGWHPPMPTLPEPMRLGGAPMPMPHVEPPRRLAGSPGPRPDLIPPPTSTPTQPPLPGPES